MADEFTNGGTVGFEPSPTAGQTNTADQTPAGGSNAVDINDDTPIRGVPGFNEPVRYGDLYKRLQGDYTRKTQQVAKEKQAFEAERQRYQQEIKAERQRIEQMAQTVLQRQSSPTNQTDPLFQKLSTAQYIDGPLMAEFITNLQQNGLAPIVKAFQERDQITQNLYKEILELRKTVGQLHGRTQEQDFEGKINRWLTEGGYPQEAKDLAKEIYNAYEGEDLDNEFPTIFAARWSQLQNIMRAQDRKRVDDAKNLSRRLPGRGGAGAPSKPVGLKGHEKARDVASALWDAIQTGEES
jgi:hypothetical protein